jgi:hypothetical protein
MGIVPVAPQSDGYSIQQSRQYFVLNNVTAKYNQSPALGFDVDVLFAQLV